MKLGGMMTYFLMYLIVVFSGKYVTAPYVDIENLNDVITAASNSPRSTQFHTSALSARGNEKSTASEIYFPDLAGFDYNERSRIIIDSLDVNHSLRQRRDITCELPTEMVQDITSLYTLLNKTMYIAGNVKQYPATVIQPEQRRDCPPEDQFMFYPVCPTLTMNYFLGRSAVPSYIPLTICRCPKCLKYPGMYCQAMYYNVTFYEHIGCSAGLAVLSKKVGSFYMGCVCVKDKYETFFG